MEGRPRPQAEYVKETPPGHLKAQLQLVSPEHAAGEGAVQLLPGRRSSPMKHCVPEHSIAAAVTSSAFRIAAKVPLGCNVAQFATAWLNVMRWATNAKQPLKIEVLLKPLGQTE